MYDHIHVLVKAPSRKAMSAFVCEYTSRFSRQRNVRYLRKGQYFRHRFGSAPKVNEKKARTAISYLYNNPVEKKLCSRAEEYRWNFLLYAHCRYPFSAPLKTREASRPMRRAIAEVRALRESDLPLNYALIDRIIKNLTANEIVQLTDYTVSLYNCISYEDLTAYYDDFQTMLTAINANTGSEYQIKEVVTPDSDGIFKEMQAALLGTGGFKDMRSVLSLSDSEKRRIAWFLAAETGASPLQISKFLQLSL